MEAYKKENTNMSKLVAILAGILAISLIGNIVLANQYQDYRELNKRLNTTWSNSIAQLAKVAHWTYIDLEVLGERRQVTDEQLNSIIANLKVTQQQLELLSMLPYGDRIIPFESREKIRIFINYQHRVMNLMKEELAVEGEVSAENLKRVEIVSQAWGEMINTISVERNKIDPFALHFQKEAWQNTFFKAIAELDQFELIPLE